MTDKKKQIEEMSRHVCTACAYEYNGSCDLHRLPGQCHKATAVAEALYEAGYRKQVEGEWISVDDRLPDKNVMVLGFIHTVYADGGSWDNILVMELSSAGYFVPFNCSAIRDNRVTHWMPLPDAPKMKGEKT